MATITKVTTSAGEVRYRVRVVTGHKADGSPIQQMRTFKTSREAEKAARAWETAIDQGITADASKIRLAAYLAEWLARAGKRVRPSTFTDYKYTVEHYLLPRVGGLSLRDTTPAALQALIDQAPSAYLAAKWRRILHIALEEAVRLNLCPMNAAERTTAPPVPKSRAQAWSTEQARRFLAYAARESYHPYWPIALHSGLRPSEVLALKWPALDLEAGTLSVVEAYPTVAGKHHEGPPKSDAGHRTIRLDPAVIGLLRAHRVAQKERRLLLGEGWHDHNLVCASEVGTPVELTNISRRFRQLCERAGVPRIRMYDLRHTATSIMIASGADLKAASEVLGHADPSITQRVYQHVNAAQRDRAVSVLASALAEEEAPHGPQQAASGAS